ncbi:hypothetical protein TSUD_280310 [Trifolium subterraneum]|uniref:DPH-type MB domain-containing protein n=1 Tax=Trifolium subterraneum TaxID=3900 RepID=A0A2Z6NBV5_TRISU|nr:hypothetical protein TSUD_280310 [Trifolium subterraneum]
MDRNEELQSYTYPCPCGDLFQITKEDLKLGEEISSMEDFLADSDQQKGIQPSKQQPVTVA